MKQVHSKTYGIIHALTFCKNCEWQVCLSDSTCNYNLQKLKNEICKHVRNTGHTVKVEIGTITNYYPKE